MADTVERIVKINVQYKDAITRLGEYRNILDAVKAAEKELKDQLKAGTITEKEYGQQMALLNQQSRLTSESYRTLTKEVQNNIRYEKQHETSLVALRSRLSNLTREFDTMTRAERESAAGLEKMKQINEVTKEIKDAEAATQRFYRNVGNYKDALQGLNELTSGFKSLGGIITGLLGGLGLEQFSQNMLNTARDFEDAIARVRAVANPMMGDFNELRNKAMELGKTTRYTATEVANGMEELARKGLNTNQTLLAIKPTLELAQANVVSIADAAQVSASTMRAFGKQAEDLSHINDVLSSACAHSATNLGLIGEAMKTAGPTARTANVSLEETTALIGSLANVGMTGSDAGTGIKQIILALTKAQTTKKGLEILEKYNLNIDEMRIKTEGIIPILKDIKESGLGQNNADMMTLVGKYAEPRMANLVKNVDDADRLLKTLQNSMGENARMFEQSIGNTSNAIYMMQSAWQAFQIEVFESTNKIITGPLNGLTAAFRFLGDHIDLVANLLSSLFTASLIAPFVKKALPAFQLEIKKNEEVVTKAIAKQHAAEEAYTKAAADEVEAIAMVEKAEADLNASRAEFSALHAERLAAMREQERINAELATVTTQTELDTLLAEYDAYTVKIQELNAKMLSEHTKYEQAKTDITLAQGLKRTASAERNAAATAMAEAQAGAAAVTSRWAKVKTTISGGLAVIGSSIAGVTKAAWGLAKAFAPLLALTAIISVGEALYTWYKNLTYVEDKIKDINEQINKAQHNETISQLQYILDRLREIDKVQNKSKDVLRDQNELRKRANGLLGTNLKTNIEIENALQRQINKLKDMAKIQGWQNAYSEQYKKIIGIGAKYNVPSGTPEGIIDFLKGLEKIKAKGIGQLSYLGQLKEAYKIWNIQGDIKDAEEAYTILQRISKYITADQIAGAIGNSNENLSITPEGDYKETGKYTPKEKKNRDEADWAALLEAIKKYHKELRSLEGDAYLDEFLKKEKEIQSALANTNEEIDTFINKNQERFKRIRARGSEYGAKVDELLDIFSDMKDAAVSKANIESAKNAYESMMSRDEAQKSEFEWRQKFMPTYSKEYFDYQSAIDISQRGIDEAKLRKQYVSGAFGKVPYDRSQDYENLRKMITDNHGNDVTSEDEKRINAELKVLDKEYSAEAKWYKMRALLLDWYQDEVTRKQRDFDIKQQQRAEQAMQNEIDRTTLRYQAELNAEHEHYSKLGYASDSYWAAVKRRIGEQDGELLRLQHDQAQLELDNIKAQGKAKDETQEAYDARRIAAEKKLEDVHTQTNLAIEKSDSQRFQAADSIVNGLIALTEELGKSDKGAAQLAKVLALAHIAINTGEAIAKMTSQEAGKGIAGIATMASGIGTILANIATAIATVKSASFARGGVNIGGAGTETSDSIPAHISRGESVINAKATKMFAPLLIAMNDIGNGVALPRNNYVQTQQTADISEAFSTAVANVRPVVDVREITSAQNRVKTIQNLDSF